ncbi:MAG: YegS/Rv2252/BmrU family lipid kinase [Bacteroidota bacterium]
MPKKILFVTNPNSGTSRSGISEEAVRNHLSSEEWEIDFIETQYAGNAKEIASDAKNDMDIVVAIGGDGTVHEIASSIVDSDTALAIIPRGSGNGLSRFLGLPTRIEDSLKVISNFQVKLIDTIGINEFRFVNMAGIGFDAHIAHSFAGFGSRGFLSYGRLVLREFRKFGGVEVDLKMNGSGVQTEDAFLISFANSSQYGNNAHIAPEAVIDDGLLDVCVMHKFPLYSSGNIAFRMFNRTLTTSKYYKSYRVSELSFQSKNPLFGHVDGEPIDLGKSGNIKVYPKSLKVIVP